MPEERDVTRKSIGTLSIWLGTAALFAPRWLAGVLGVRNTRATDNGTPGRSRQDSRFGTGGSAIVLSSSTDGGLTWSGPTVVNGDTTVQAFTASVEANSDGVVGVT